jgi:hypothetical protein
MRLVFRVNETMQIVRCVSCDGYGWLDDEEQGEIDCDWCGGVGYVYRDERGADHHIPAADYEALAETLEQLETERLREMGYSGSAKKPWQQAIRRERGDGLLRYGDIDREDDTSEE